MGVKLFLVKAAAALDADAWAKWLALALVVMVLAVCAGASIGLAVRAFEMTSGRSGRSR